MTVTALAARQHAAVAGEQLASAGLGRGAIAHRVATGRLRRLHHGVYLVGPLEAPLTPQSAALLAYGDRAVLSHRTAAHLWQLTPSSPAAVDVTVPDGSPRQKQGVRLHRTTTLAPEDVTHRERLRLTTPARTLLDLATLLPPRELDRAIEQAEILRLTTHHQLALLTRRRSTARGAAAMRRALTRHSEPSLTRSEAEHRLLSLIRKAGLPHPRTNARIHGLEVDLLWPAQRLVVEVDGFAFHSTRQAFERDRRRDARLQAAGYRVIRITWRQIVDEPETVVALLAAALAQAQA